MMAMCATMECSMLPLLIMELFTPARSVTRVFMYVNYLRRRYACKATRSSVSSTPTVMLVSFTSRCGECWTRGRHPS